MDMFYAKNDYFCGSEKSDVMKKILPIIAALAALALMLCSCEKHAMSETWVNHFSVSQGTSTYVSDGTTKMSVAETVTIFATGENNERLAGGKYTVENNSEGVVSATAGASGITVTGIKAGTGSVYVHWIWKGFDMHRSITFTVVE